MGSMSEGSESEAEEEEEEGSSSMRGLRDILREMEDWEEGEVVVWLCGSWW